MENQYPAELYKRKKQLLMWHIPSQTHCKQSYTHREQICLYISIAALIALWFALWNEFRLTKCSHKSLIPSTGEPPSLPYLVGRLINLNVLKFS